MEAIHSNKAGLLQIQTSMGRMAVECRDDASSTNGKVPLVLLHGIFFDRTLWSGLPIDAQERQCYFVDMPAHGESDNVGRRWELRDCEIAMIEMLDAIGIERCIAVGHSWGAMTILSAATRNPNRFSAIGLVNMPFRRVSGMSRLGFQIQKQLMRFRAFYAQKAAQSLYTKSYLANNPSRIVEMQQRLSRRPLQELQQVINAVLLQATDASEMLTQLQVPALAVVGKEDYVGTPPGVKTTMVPGGHISPHEAAPDVADAIRQLIQLGDTG